jgi:hypothetical protein
MNEKEIEEVNSEKKTVVPHLFYRELVCALFALIIIVAFSLAFDAPLEGKVNPAITPNPAKAPWFFLPVQELLVYFDPWLAGVVIPFILVLALITLPYLDFNREGANRYAFSKRKLAILIFCATLLVWFGLLYIAYFFRCEHWQFRFRFPFQSLPPMELEKVSPRVYSLLTLSTGAQILPESARSVITISAARHGYFIYVLFLLAALLILFGAPYLFVRLFRKELSIATRINFAKAYVLSFYVWVFILVLLKIYFYWATNLKYFLVTDWVNI